MIRRATFSIFILAALTGCDRSNEANLEANSPGATEGMLTESLTSGTGEQLGEATLSEDANGVMVRIAVRNLSPGAHGLHIHTVGRCEGPRFDTAGPHWNPTNRKHGRDSPEGAHTGDLANLQVEADGRGSSAFTIARARLTGGEAPLIDLDGAAVVVHARADDYKTDPSGDSGDRIACAAFNR